MKNFTKWIEEAKKTKESLPPTATSSPLRGQNQDQSGYNGKNDVADYTISDETKPKKVISELSPELVGKVNKARSIDGKPSKTIAAAKTLSTAVKKAWLKAKAGETPKAELDELVPDNWEDNSPAQRKHTVKNLLGLGNRHGASEFKESSMMAAVTSNRIKPVNMGQSTGGQKKDPNAPRNVNRMQSAANSRVIQLDRAAQQQKEDQKKQKEQEIADRKRDTESRKQKAHKPQISEGRHRKEPATEEEPGSEHVIMQLRKVVSSRGIHPVTHVSGEKSEVTVKDAHKALAHHDSLKTSAEKNTFAKRLHRSATSMHDAMSGKPEQHKPKISLGGKITGTQN